MTNYQIIFFYFFDFLKIAIGQPNYVCQYYYYQMMYPVVNLEYTEHRLLVCHGDIHNGKTGKVISSIR